MTPINLCGFDRSSTPSRIRAWLLSAARLLLNAPRLALARHVVVQYPLGRLNEVLLSHLRCGRVSVCFIHDLEMLRTSAMARRESRTLARFDVLVAHSRQMAKTLRACQPDASVVVLGAFDFLGAVPNLPTAAEPKVLYVVGNLTPDKAAYLYDIDATTSAARLELYGPSCDISRLPGHVRYKGLLDPLHPPFHAVDGFGLVWDGDSPNTLVGVCGDYLRYNAPHKFSLYLALGMPVIVPAEAAIADIVRQYGVGVCVESVEDGLRFVDQCTSDVWSEMVAAVRQLQVRLRSGGFTAVALARAGVLDDQEPQRVLTTAEANG